VLFVHMQQPYMKRSMDRFEIKYWLINYVGVHDRFDK